MSNKTSFFGAIKSLLNTTTAVVEKGGDTIVTNLDTINELSKLGNDNAKSMRVKDTLELEKEFNEMGVTVDDIKRALATRKELFSALD